jgi:hypothetical protein
MYTKKGNTRKRTTLSKSNKTKKTAISKNTYSNEDYQSNNGMLTTIWGPGTWHLLHTISFNYPVNPTPDDKIHYMQFIKNLKYVLPCGKCRKNLAKNFQKLPLKMSDMASRHTFSLYVYHFHELINKMLGKVSGLSYEDVRERYEHFRARCAKPVSEWMPPSQKEKGCTESLYGEKSKCVIHIVPESVKCETFQMDEKCIKKKLHNEAEESANMI